MGREWEGRKEKMSWEENGSEEKRRRGKELKRRDEKRIKRKAKGKE